MLSYPACGHYTITCTTEVEGIGAHKHILQIGPPSAQELHGRLIMLFICFLVCYIGSCANEKILKVKNATVYADRSSSLPQKRLLLKRLASALSFKSVALWHYTVSHVTHLHYVCFVASLAHMNDKPENGHKRTPLKCRLNWDRTTKITE